MNHISGLRELHAALQVDALLLTSELSIRYAMGFPLSDAWALITPDAAYLLTDFRYEEEAKSKLDSSISVVTPPSFFEFLSDVFATEHLARIGYEDTTLSCADFSALTEKLSFCAVPIGSKIQDLRAVKDAEETEAIKKAQEITDKAFSHILSSLTPTMTEIDVVLELEFFMRRMGADAIAFPTIAVSGSGSALPHGTARNIPLSRGFLTMDFGASYNGYASDMTRTVVLGSATAEMKRLYDTVREAQRLGMEIIREGVSAADVDKVARDYIDREGYHKLFGHSFGHGVGLEIHENPRLSRTSGDILRAGNVVTAEPGIYRMGEYGCRIENLGVVTKGGFLCFTQSTTDLIELF